MMVNKDSVRRAMDARLSGLTASPERRARIRNAALSKAEPKMKRKITAALAFALAALLLLAGAALAVKTNLFARFAARDARYGEILEQVTEVAETPAAVEDEKLDAARAYVDSAYYDGQTLTLAFVVENGKYAETWTPTAEELAQMEASDADYFPIFGDDAPCKEEIELEQAYLKAREAGTPFGYRKDSVWVHDTFYTDDGVELPPDSGDVETGENGELYEVREFTQLPRSVAARDVLSVYAELGRSTVYYYFDGEKDYWSVDVQREGVGRIQATVPRKGAEVETLVGSGMLNGANCTVEATAGAMQIILTITADADVFPPAEHETADGSWTEQPWMAAVYDETGREYHPREGAQAAPGVANRLVIPFEGSGSIPRELTVYVYRCGIDDEYPGEETIREGAGITLRKN